MPSPRTARRRRTPAAMATSRSPRSRESCSPRCCAVSDRQSAKTTGSAPGDVLLSAGGLARALLEQSPFSTVVYSPGGRPVYSNPAFERYWNTSLAHVPPTYTVLEDPQLAEQGFIPLIER